MKRSVVLCGNKKKNKLNNKTIRLYVYNVNITWLMLRNKR